LSFPPIAIAGVGGHAADMNAITGTNIVNVGLLARIVAKPGKESEVEALLTGALALAQAEEATTVWFALRLSPSQFGIFDAFADDAGRQAHLAGRIAAALMGKAEELLAEPPRIDAVDILAAKLGG
jgi:quinol monooxygenase YgiN